MVSIASMLGLCVVLQEGMAELPPPLPDEPARAEPAPKELPPAVADQLIDFNSENVVEIQRDAVQVRVMGSGRVGTLKVRQVKTPVMGRDRRVLSWPEFYDAVERPDLRREWAWLALGGSTLTLGGLLASFGSVVPLLVAMGLGLGVVYWDKRQGNTGNGFTLFTALGLGIILAGAAVMTTMILVGSGMVWAGRELPDQPVDNADLLMLAEDHNRSVLEQAGLAP